MRLLLDENIPKPTEDALRVLGHSVLRAPVRTKDETIARAAEAKRVILLTRDDDFLNFLPPTHSGIVVIRIHPPVAEAITRAVRMLLEAHPERWLRGKALLLRRDGYELVR
ncbi:MAG: DUF5615 family PIN-like protein [Candidatus Omnitrophica bacterium]|nr:DUF5615 family PIN-like protein [Candidatus Omnitrophota bacterium]